MNDTEKTVAQFCRKSGYTVCRNGWPDFLLVNEQRGFALEVKTRNDRLSGCQRKMIDALDRMGIITHTKYADEVEQFLTDGPIATPAMGRSPYRRLTLHCERVMRRLDDLEKRLDTMTDWHNRVLYDVQHELKEFRKTFNQIEMDLAPVIEADEDNGETPAHPSYAERLHAAAAWPKDAASGSTE